MKKTKLYLFIIGSVLITSCGPINMFTKVKRIPRTYSYNYCVEELKAPKSTLNEKEWIVYSDRNKNSTTMNAGGRLKMKDLEYLDPLLVIGKKRDYYKVIKYDPAILNNGKLAKRKDVEYYGWIHKSKLLLNNQSVTDLRTGLKNKSIITISDPEVVKKANLFFENDSVKAYMSPGLYSVTNLINPNDLIYILKRATDRSKVLISRKPYVTPDNVKDNVLGWISSDLIQGVGQQLFMKDWLAPFQNDRLKRQASAMTYKPIISRKDTSVFKTASLYPVIDRSDNCIFNVNGSTIAFNKKAIIDEELKRINITFMIEPGEHTIDQLPALINSFQNMNPLFTDEDYSFRYASVITSYESGNLVTHTVPFTDNFNDVIMSLVKLTGDDILKPIPSRLSWKGFETCMSLIEMEKPATNLIVTFGEKGSSNHSIAANIIQKASEYNCRFLGYQMYSGRDNEYNNFVTQFTDLINSSAKLLSEQKKELIVYSDQVTKTNDFVSSAKNTFHLDFPERSMTQGGICFPEKGQILRLDQITSFIDSILLQIKSDNNNLVQSIDKAFITVGNSKDKYDRLFTEYFLLKKDDKIESSFKESFRTTYPYWCKQYNDTLHVDSLCEFRLLLSELELDIVRNVFDVIADLNVDTKIIGELRGQKAKGYCDCPGEFIEDIYVPAEDTGYVPKIKYRSTRKTRKAFKVSLLSELYSCPFCKTKASKRTQKLTLAELHEQIFQAPTSSDMLNSVTIKSITRRKLLSRKRLLSDEEFEDLLDFYKDKKAILDIEINDKVSFSSSDQLYYWVDTNWFQ